MATIDQTHFQSAFPKETRLPPPGEMVITPETLERLKVPDEVLLRPESVNPFMAGQWVKLTDIVNRPEIKTASADIPEYIHDEAFNAYPPMLNSEEQSALESWTLQIQSESPSDDDLLNRMDAYINEMMREHPEIRRPGGSGGGNAGADPIDSLLMREFQETEEEKKKFWEALAAARGSPETVNLILGWRYAKQISKQLGKLVNAYSFQIDQKEKMLAEFDLANKRGTPTAADMAGFNAKLAASQTDSSFLMFQIQSAVTKAEGVVGSTARAREDIGRPLQVMIQNMQLR